jgi:YegS/Rv2252/BmrU family lipid kinase
VLGVLPGGRGNDFARVLGIPEDPIAACAALAGASPRPVDLGVVAQPGRSGRAFIGIASVGFDSDANRIANEAPAWLGGQVYAYGALRALVSWRPARFEIELHPSGERHGFTGYTVAAANSRAYGGGMHMAPNALLDDGELELIAVEKVGKASFVANLPKVFAGTHVELPSVRALRAAEVTISADRPFTAYADGDPIGELPVRVSALPGAINVIVPRQSPDGPFAHPSPLSASPLAREPGASPAAG